MIDKEQLTSRSADNFCDQQKLYAEPDPACLVEKSGTGVKLYSGVSPRGSNERSEVAQ